MKISRSGASAYHGNSNIDFKEISVSWNAKDCVIELKSNGVRDFNTKSKHDYKISIPLVDIAEIIRLLGNEGVAHSAAEIEAAFEGKLKALNRIVAASSGLVKSAESNA